MPPTPRASPSSAPSSAIDQEKLAEAKDQLRLNTEEAAARGVFGVPSFVVDGEVFWGADAVDFVKAFVGDASVLHNAEMRRVIRSTSPRRSFRRGECGAQRRMRRVDALPVAAARKA